MSASTCVIGGGMSGIVAAKTLLEEGVEFDWFEKSSALGGVWCYREEPSVFSVYDCCRTIGCKHTMSFVSYPVPESMEEYPTHREYHAYLMGYVDNFGLREKVRLSTEVESVTKLEGGRWSLRLSTGETREYEHVVVTTGQFHEPMIPEYSGEFSGPAMHSAYYRTAEPYEDKRVLVIGLGNSGVDIACDIAKVAKKTYLSTRESAHIMPKFVLGKPFLHFHSPMDDYLPFWLNRFLTRFLVWVGRGRLRSYSFPAPKHRVLLKNPTMSDQILEAVRDGVVEMKTSVASFANSSVHFDDGSAEEIDAVVYTTGYKTQFRFFDPEFLAFERDRFHNYLHVANMDHEKLYFIGIVDPFGTYPNIVELQAQMVSSLIAKRCALPPAEVMRREMASHEIKMRKMMCDETKRPMIREKFFRYQHRLKRFLSKQAVGA